MEELALPLMLEAMWAANVVDVERTVGKACRLALKGDGSLSPAARKQRVRALGDLAAIFADAADAGEAAQPSVLAHGGARGAAGGGAGDIEVGRVPLDRTQEARTKLQDALTEFQKKKMDDLDDN